MSKLVTKTLTEIKISPTRRKQLERLSQRPDSKIDTSDIPELDAKFWKNAIPNPYYRPRKQQLTVRLDADLVAWLRQQGKGYQTRLNSIVRAAMLEQAPRNP